VDTVRRIDPTGTTTNTWNALNRLTYEAVPGLSISYSYDKVGNLLTVQDRSGTVRYTYDDANQQFLYTYGDPGVRRQTGRSPT